MALSIHIERKRLFSSVMVNSTLQRNRIQMHETERTWIYCSEPCRASQAGRLVLNMANLGLMQLIPALHPFSDLCGSPLCLAHTANLVFLRREGLHARRQLFSTDFLKSSHFKYFVHCPHQHLNGKLHFLPFVPRSSTKACYPVFDSEPVVPAYPNEIF